MAPVCSDVHLCGTAVTDAITALIAALEISVMKNVLQHVGILLVSHRMVRVETGVTQLITEEAGVNFVLQENMVINATQIVH